MESTRTKEKLNEQIAQVQALLKKQKLVETVVQQHGSHKQKDIIESLVHRQHLAELNSKLKRLHIADIAHILEILPVEDRHSIWALLAFDRGGEILLEVSESVRKSLVASLTKDQLKEVLKQLDGDDLAYIADDLPEDALKSRLASLSSAEQDWLKSAMQYDEDTVGYLMSNEMVVIRESDTLALAESHLRSLKEFPIHTDKLFVVDSRGLLTGVLSLQNILHNDPDNCARDIMAREVVKFTPEDNASDASKAFERYDLVSAPVINSRGKLIGRLTVDIVMDYIREESADDVLNMVGVSGEEDLFASFLDSAKNRGPWLFVNLITAFLASRVIGLFEETIVQLVALATLMPIVASVGGNTGNQTTALIVRAISLGQITPDNTLLLLKKEISVSAINGLLLGLVVGLFSFVLYRDSSLSLVLAGSLQLTLIMAAIIGLAVPVLLERKGRDPALGSSVILTAATDSIGFFIFLGLATLFLI